jgi:nucleoside 2-deoxyribosyltransferase
MKIFIAGSMYFAKEMIKTQQALEEMGHEAIIPGDTHACLENPDLAMDFDHCIKTDIMHKCFDEIAESDAIVVLNHEKNNMKGYVGGCTLMEIGLASHLKKRIFLLHPPPSEEQLRYSLEIKLARPVILEGDLQKIKDFL